MNKEEIEKNNLMLAKFVGINVYLKWNDFLDATSPLKSRLDLSKHVYGAPDFNKSWNRLMSVVDKIESLDDKELFYKWEYQNKPQYNFQYYDVDISRNSCYIVAELSLDPPMTIAHEILDTKIEAVFNSVVEFVKWRNKKIK